MRDQDSGAVLEVARGKGVAAMKRFERKISPYKENIKSVSMDMPIAALMSPPLTTIRQQRDLLGGASYRRLLERIANPALPANEIFFPAPLVVRESTMKRKVKK